MKKVVYKIMIDFKHMNMIGVNVKNTYIPITCLH